MSRGHGAVQSRVLERLAEHANEHPPLADFDTDNREPWPSFLSVAALADGGTRSERESVRRAAIKLQAEGLVELLVVRRTNAHSRVMGTFNLCARLVPDEDTAADWQARYDEQDAQRRAKLAAYGL